jgi:hypothetical protein
MQNTDVSLRLTTVECVNEPAHFFESWIVSTGVDA